MAESAKQGTGSTGRNRLATEKSPYLLQHANNPVDWYPWGEEAFEKAKRENKPIFLSVGYSTCHWCHVMERESFENEQVAQLLNKYFVPIKVDREERPDVDGVYMTFIQATNGNGGWPMSVFLTPQLVPFIGTTYLPPDRFASALSQIASKWNSDREEIEREGSRVLEALQQYVNAPRKDNSLGISANCLEQAFKETVDLFDEENGGFGTAPKFPRPAIFDFLFSFYWFRGVNTEEAKESLRMALVTLRNMANGGIYDHLGGGFHRYSVDRYWHVPHFEKMLYDQAQLLKSYVDAYVITKEEHFRGVAEGIIEYVLRDMTDKQTGGFYSAEDADSIEPFSSESNQNEEKKKEGAYYTWTDFECKLILGPRVAKIGSDYYGIKPEGNAPAGSDPFGELSGKNILKISKSLEDVCKASSISLEEGKRVIQEAKDKLFAQRRLRVRPHLDDKLVTSWNSMMICSLVKAYESLGKELYLQKAVEAANFIKREMIVTDSDGRTFLFRSYRHGPSSVKGFVEDYAHTIHAFLSLYQVTGEAEWLQLALLLQTTQDSIFYDNINGGYFSTSSESEHILLRRKDDYDSSEPSPSSVSGLNLYLLWAITGNSDFYRRMKETVEAFSIPLNKSPFGLPAMLRNCCILLKDYVRIVIVGNPQAPDTKKLQDVVFSRFQPNRVLVSLTEENKDYLTSTMSAEYSFMKTRNNLPTAYVCLGTVCKEPITSPEELERLLDASTYFVCGE
eukprot:jgi/Galph1/2635/GphlegSOOS_G1315.1